MGDQAPLLREQRTRPTITASDLMNEARNFLLEAAEAFKVEGDVHRMHRARELSRQVAAEDQELQDRVWWALPRPDQTRARPDDVARREGFPDAAAFEAGFSAINRGGYDPALKVYVIGIRPVLCVGFGETKGACGKPSDVELNDSGLWCTACERARRDHISGQMALVSASFGATA